MKPFVANIPIKSKSNCILLRGFFDLHSGTKACDLELFKEHVEECRITPNMYAFLGGDMCECINPQDKRFDAKGLSGNCQKNLDNLIMTQANEVIDILRPIKDKLLFSLEGNHEDKFRRMFSMDVGNYIAMALGIPMLGYSAFVRIQFHLDYKYGKPKRFGIASRAVHLFATHGAGGGIKLGSKINRLGDLLTWLEADVYWMGHVHGLGVAQATRMYLTRQDEPRVFDKNKVLLLGGTYLRTYDKSHSGYGERKLYQPTPMGCMTLKITPFPGSRMEHGKKVELAPTFEVTTSIPTTLGNGCGDLWDIEPKGDDYDKK